LRINGACYLSNPSIPISSGLEKRSLDRHPTKVSTEEFRKEDSFMWGKALLLISSTILVGSMLIQPALGIEYPRRTIQIICPYTAGGGADLLSRLVANTASKYLGQPVVVVNKPGGGGSVAGGEVLSSKPDGYKIVQLPNNFFGATIYTEKVPFGPNDFAPIANFMYYKLGFIVKSDSPWKTFGDLLDYGRKNPGKLRWGHPSRGSPLFMNTVLIFKKARISAIEVPYMGTGDLMNALLGGHLDAVASSFGFIRDQLRVGTLRCLVTYSEQRYSGSPDIPTVVELGFPEAAKMVTYVGMYAHKDTPEEIRKILFNAFKKTYDDPEFKKGMENFGEGSIFTGPEFMKEDIEKYAEASIPMLKEFGLYVGK
jgi:tripartite-type tricarboxylate transporter receptor subunit TctC